MYLVVQIIYYDQDLNISNIFKIKSNEDRKWIKQIISSKYTSRNWIKHMLEQKLTIKKNLDQYSFKRNGTKIKNYFRTSPSSG